MSTNRMIQTLTGALRAWLVTSLVLGSLLAALPLSAALAQFADDGSNPGANESVNMLAVQADSKILVGDGFTKPEISTFADVSTESYSKANKFNGTLEPPRRVADAAALPMPSLTAALTTTDSMVYLPLVMNNFPFTPDAPMLNAISNADGDGNYSVSWSSSEGADTYTLQEGVSADFSSPTIVHSGPSTSTAISGRDVGAYYYRVKASNPYASSDWSNVESLEVTVPLPDCPQAGPWRGPTSQEGGREIEFYVEDSPQCQVNDLRIEFRDSCGSERTTFFEANPPIASNHFNITGAGTTVTGDFSSSNTASGTFSYSEGGCTASGTWTAALNLGANGTVNALAVQSDGKIVVGGSFSWLGGQRRDRIGRLNADGTIDDSFNPGADGTVNALAVQADGKIVVGGRFEEMGGQTRYYIARLNPDGTLDTGFNPGDYDNGNSWVVNSLAVQADGKIVVGGYFDYMGGQWRENIARLNPDGSLDTTFNPGAGSRVYTLALQEDGKILVGIYGYLDYSSRSPIKRLNPDGSADFSVSATGSMFNTYVYTLLVQADGKILVGGDFSKLDGVSRSDIGRLNPDGTLDGTFNPGANLKVYTFALQSDDKILVGGTLRTLGGETRERIGRLNPDGSLDVDFNPGASSSVYALAVQTDGKILVGGGFTTLGGETHYYIGRLNPDGTLDATFP